MCVQIGKSTTNVGQLGVLANQLTRDYAQLASASCGAAGATTSSDVSVIHVVINPNVHCCY